MATCPWDRDDPDLAPSLARGTRRGRGGSGVLAATGCPSADRRQPFVGRARSVAGIAVGLGVLAALAVFAIDAAFASLVPSRETTPAISAPPLWTGVLAALYGGLTEEIVVHYGVMSLLVWLLT